MANVFILIKREPCFGVWGVFFFFCLFFIKSTSWAYNGESALGGLLCWLLIAVDTDELEKSQRWRGVEKTHSSVSWLAGIEVNVNQLGWLPGMVLSCSKRMALSVGLHPVAVDVSSRGCWWPGARLGMRALLHCCSHPEIRLRTLLQSSSQFCFLSVLHW